ncbi:MAG: hypothetical protein DDT20_00680 [Firmicutes bacterium]|nr:hypothetical protein [Bacillota bacterium]
MPTWHTANFRNIVINTLRAGGTTAPFYGTATEIAFYSGAPPVAPENAVTGTLLVVATPASNWWSAPSGGIAPFPSGRSTSATGTTGTIGYARLTGSSVIVGDFTAGIVGSGADIILDSLSFSNGVARTITNFAFRLPLAAGTIRLSSALANALVANWVTGTFTNIIFADAAASLSIFSGSAPATADDAPTGTLLWTTALSATTWAAVSGGACVLTANLTANAVATGTAGYARIIRGSHVIQGSVGTSAANFILSTLSLVSATSASVTEATLALP